MKLRTRFASSLIILTSLFWFAASVHAGGWVVISLDNAPGPIQAGDTAHIGFMVRQHGKTPINNVSPTLTATNQETGETITVSATQAGKVGHFEATVTLTEAGQWDWSISAPPFPQQQQFAPLTVIPAETTVASSASITLTDNWRTAMRWGGGSLLALAILLALVGERRRRDAIAAGSPA
jgi:hypothetical protein